MEEDNKKRKIIEIYVTENKDTGNKLFEFEKIEDTEAANAIMNKILMMFSNHKDVEVEYE